MATPVLVSFLIPVYNEEATILEVLRRVDELELAKQVIVVDDGSTDRTAEIAESHGATVLRQANAGKGAALRTAIRAIRSPMPKCKLSFDATQLSTSNFSTLWPA